MTTMLKLPLVAVLALAAGPAFANEIALLPAADGDQVPSTLVAAKRALADGIERAPVEFSWALDPAAKLDAPAPYVADSREFWTEVEGAALAKGVTLRTTASGAVVRLSPRAGVAAPELAADDVVVRQGGRTLRGADAIVDADVALEFKSLGMAMPERTLAFRLGAGVDAGAFELSIAKARGAYLVHVFEPASAERLTLTSDRATAVAGGTIELVAALESPAGRTLGRVGGLATSPSGDAIELAFARGSDGAWRAPFAPPANATPGLWDVHAFAASADGELARDATVAIAVGAPTARIVGASRNGKGAATALDVTLEVAAAGRYNVSAVLYATDASGALVPAAIAHSAAVLGAGRHALTLAFAPETLASAGLGTPYEVRELALTNQGDLAPIEKRARAFAFE